MRCSCESVSMLSQTWCMSPLCGIPAVIVIKISGEILGKTYARLAPYQVAYAVTLMSSGLHSFESRDVASSASASVDWLL